MRKLIKKIILGIIPKIQETEYDYIYSSRKVIKNEDISKNSNHFYDVDIWKLANDEIAKFLPKGVSAYYEIVGFTPEGKEIQKDYDYGCKPNEHKIFIYRITYTNTDGKVFEFSAKQVQDFCKKNGLNAVPELYYGYAKEFSDERLNKENWGIKFLETIKNKYNEKDCFMCSNKVVEEGVVIRVENLEFEAYKQKSFGFYQHESAVLDQNIEDIESEN